jgi:ubiquinol-cytochrome c reductase cytochrome c1 subunit
VKAKKIMANALLALSVGVSLSIALTAPALAAGGPEVKIVGTTASRVDAESLQRGARLFVNHCLNCHSAQYMRYNRLTDIKLTPDQIKQNLMFTTDKIGDTMKAAISPKDAKEWFGAVPPDLSVMSRSYTSERLAAYMRGFYRDDARETGWNNIISPNIGMPHVLAELSGTQTLAEQVFKADGKDLKNDGEAESRARAAFIAADTMSSFEHRVDTKDGKTEHSYIVKSLVPATDGRMTPVQYDVAVADLVNFMDYVAEPHKAKRIQIGILVMFLLSILLAAAVWLKKEFWKDVH